MPTLLFSLAATTAMKNNIVRMKKEPDVPNSNTLPETEFKISPEKNEDVRAIIGKRTIGIKNLAFGICIMPLERVEAKNTEINNTMTVTKNANFEE
jgi:hypothetical protein